MSVQPTPDYPVSSSRQVTGGTSPADPDIIVIDDSSLPIEVITDLLFQSVGGQELINVSRHDLINGLNSKPGIVANLREIQLEYESKNIIPVSGAIEEHFKSFRIKLGPHVPNNGTGPAPYYVGDQGSNAGCTDPNLQYPVLDRYDDSLIGCYATFEKATNAINIDLAPFRPIVYSDPQTGNIVVDVTRMKPDERVQIEVLAQGTIENDTIY